MFRDKIRNAYDELSPSFRRIADFLLDRTYEATFLSGTQLASQVNTDAILITRFAQHLGYRGNPRLLAEVQADVKEDLDRYLNPTPFTAEPGPAALAAIRREIHNLELLERSLNPKDLARFIDLALKAERIVVVGEGASRVLASLFAHALRTLNLNAKRHRLIYAGRRDGLCRPAARRPGRRVSRVAAT